jgi:serine acetyltransferase
VVIGTGATILGPITIGTRSKIGVQGLVLESLLAGSIVLDHVGSIVHRCRSCHRCATGPQCMLHIIVRRLGPVRDWARLWCAHGVR